MTITAAAVRTAERMGARAGKRYARTGIPSLCPFTSHREELRAAWRRAYLDAAEAGGSR